ncbi:MAG: hypothetical protein AB8G22_09270, partial [Saprospiraceae bacterium]
MNMLRLFILLLLVSLINTAFAQPTPTIYYVNSTGDGSDFNLSDGTCAASFWGDCTLRAALEPAHANGGNTVIRFSSNINTPATFNINTPLPALTKPNILIDGGYLFHQLGDIIINGNNNV